MLAMQVRPMDPTMGRPLRGVGLGEDGDVNITNFLKSFLLFAAGASIGYAIGVRQGSTYRG